MFGIVDHKVGMELGGHQHGVGMRLVERRAHGQEQTVVIRYRLINKVRRLALHGVELLFADFAKLLGLYPALVGIGARILDSRFVILMNGRRLVFGLYQ